MKHHRRRIGRLVARLINAAHDELPLARINVAFHGHDVADLEIVPVGDVDADDAGVALALERFELLGRNDKFRIDVEKRIGIDRQAREKLILVDINAGKPDGISDLVDARHLGNAIAISERQRKNKRDRVARDQAVRRRGLDPRIPSSDHGLEQSECHHRDADADDREQASKFVAQGIAQQ